MSRLRLSWPAATPCSQAASVAASPPLAPALVQDVAETLVEALEKGKKVLALIGFGAVKSGAGHELKQLVERYQIPFATTLDGKGIISERHPLCVGVFCDSGHSAAWKAFL